MCIYKKVISYLTHCVKLKKAIYGLVQAARQWWKKFKTAMEGIGYVASPIDPCLFIKKKEGQDPSFIIIYVDDGGIIGTPKDVKEVIEGLSKEFKIKSLGKMEHFVGCHIIEKENQTWIHQPKLLKNLNKHFGSLITSERSYKTPGAPKTSHVTKRRRSSYYS